MYKLVKDNGHNMTISVINTEEKKQFNLGTCSHNIANVLEANDMKVGEILPYIEAWDVEITKEVANELVATTSTIKKPIRVKSEQKKPEPEEEECIFDMIFGASNL